METQSILVISEDQSFINLLSMQIFSEFNYSLIEVSTLEKYKEALSKQNIIAVIGDYVGLSQKTGQAFQYIVLNNIVTPFILLTEKYRRVSAKRIGHLQKAGYPIFIIDDENEYVQNDFKRDYSSYKFRKPYDAFINTFKLKQNQ